MKPAPVAVNTTVNKPSTPTPKGFRLGRALAIVATLCGLLLIAVLAAPYLLPWFLQQQGIDFDWEKPRWQLGGFHASNIQLTLTNSDAELKQLTIDHLHMQWSIKTQPIQRLHVDHLQVDWPLNQDPASTETTPFKLPQALLRWLPQQLELSHIDANIGGLGRLQGSLKLHASANGTLWQPATIQTALSLKNLQGAWLDLIPAELQPTELNVHIATTPDHPSNATDRQLLELDLRSVGATRLQLKGLLDLQHTPHWQGAFKQAQLTMHLDELKHPNLHAEQLKLHAHLSAQANASDFSIQIDPDAKIVARNMNFMQFNAAHTQFDITDLSIMGSTAAPLQAYIRSSFSAQAQQLTAPQLHTQNWDLNGTLNGELAQLALKADIHNTQGLQLSTTATLNQSAVQGQISLKNIFFKAGNPLQKTLTDWPDIMSFDNGKLNAQGHFTLPFKGAMALALTGQASKLSGIVNRSELTNLDFNFDAQLSDTDLKLSIPNLKAEQLNPGIPISLMELSHAQYQAPFTDLLSGHLNWQHAQANVLNGRVWLAAQQLNLQQPQTVLLQVDGLELQELFRVYPAEGLSGTGTIDGQLPIHFNHTDFSINAGQLQARAPGVLQFQSDKINALGKTNPTMRIVADALEDFHFNVLSSGLSYDESGKLLLNVRLEGQNPDVEKGRPINLNVNLEEDIPALLASIQLSNQVSEIIQKRIRERLERR